MVDCTGEHFYRRETAGSLRSSNALFILCWAALMIQFLSLKKEKVVLQQELATLKRELPRTQLKQLFANNTLRRAAH